MAYEICLMMSLARILLGTDRWVTPLQLLQLLKSPFFGIFMIYPLSSCQVVVSPTIWQQRVAEELVLQLWLCLEEFCAEVVLSCLICQFFHIGLLVCPYHPLHCLVCFLVLLPISLFQPL